MRAAVVTVLLIGWIFGGPFPALAQAPDQQATVLHLSETAKRAVMRDVLRAELRVEETGVDPRTVQSAINRRMAAALDRARQVQGLRLEAGSYSVGQERPANAAARWRGSQAVTLVGKDTDAILKLVGTRQSDGLSTSSLRYEVSPETVRAAQEELTAAALAALDRRAAAIAGDMHLSVLRYRDLRVGNAEGEGRPVPRFAAMAAAPPVAEPGEAMVQVSVEAELLLAGLRS